MTLKIPSAGTPVTASDLLRGICGRSNLHRFAADLRAYLDTGWCGLTGSGTAAFFAILQVLRTRSDKQEVLLPAYTAPSLILPIRKAGLQPVLCDVSPATLNTGSDDMLARIGPRTLAVTPVHMFGLPTDIDILADQLSGRDVFLVEDACSAMGTRMHGKHAGTFGDIGFYSFNRGKNLATLSGGAVITSRDDLSAGLERSLSAFPPPGIAGKLRIAAYTAALAAAVRPLGYTLMYPAVSRFKYTELHTDFETRAYTRFQARIGRALLSRADAIFRKRWQHSAFLQQALSGLDGVRLPELPAGADPVYSQFPVLLTDERTRDAVFRAINRTGLETTRLYPEPIHRTYAAFWDGRGADPFPGATAIARRLLLFPVHATVPHHALERAVEVLGNTLK